MSSVVPRLALPSRIRSDVPGTWAYDTMSRRVLETLDTVIRDSSSEKSLLEELRSEIVQNAVLRPLADGGKDVEAWNALLGRDEGSTWLSAPWLLSEFYLYRRIASAMGYFDGNGRDFFAAAKQKGLDSSLKTIANLARKLEGASSELSASSRGVSTFLFVSLWGNRMDLSLWPEANVAATGDFEAVLARGRENLLCDHAARAAAYVASLKDATVDIVVDNAGFELCSDLFLADHLLATKAASVVRLRVKHHPTFVSDVVAGDVAHHVDALTSRGDDDDLKPFADRCRTYLDDGRLVCLDDDGYWAMPYPLWEMPDTLRAHLRDTSDLTILKGDANYRRALGDRTWALDAPFEDVCSYFPAPLLCLRTLKAELGCGMDPDKIAHAAKADPNWLTDGKWGVLQFVQPSTD